MTQHTDQQLKLALAKMLPETIHWNENFDCLIYTDSPLIKVLDTELLHLCWLGEETLYYDEGVNYCKLIAATTGQTRINVPMKGTICHATWQQRTIALAATKGIEIV